MENKKITFSTFIWPGIVCGLMILLHINNYYFQSNNNWDESSIFKLKTADYFFDALPGIFLSPFAHGNNEHLINNIIPLFFLMCLIRYVFDKFAYILFLLSYFFTGLLIWRFVPNHVVIGASGVLYAMVSFLFFSGLIRGNRELWGYSLLIVFLYGSMVWGVFPFSVEEGVSWQGHLMGSIVGFVLALVFREIGPQKKIYDWEDDEDDEYDEGDKNNRAIKVNYHYRK